MLIYPQWMSQIIPSEFPPFSPKIVVLTRKPREKGRPTLATNPHHWGQDPHYYSYWRSPLIPIPGDWMLLEATFSGRCLWLYSGSIDHISYSKPKEDRKVNSTTTQVIEYDRILSLSFWGLLYLYSSIQMNHMSIKSPLYHHFCGWSLINKSGSPHIIPIISHLLLDKSHFGG